ncbi:MAG: DUF4435 domain-containing protein [Saprospiraceae bacterium]|nr:DUF4435 domain-containing protein [Saprospiraceae bacterium]
MSEKQKPPRPIEEIISAMIHPATMGSTPKPYVFVEGTDDVVIYREIVERVGLSTSFPFFGERRGRKPLFDLYEKVDEYKSRVKSQVLFFADRDTSVFSPYFAEFEDKTILYPQINFTKGYSIENDLFEDGQERIMEKLRSNEERLRLNSLLESICEWFAVQMELHKNGDYINSEIDISIYSTEVIDSNGQTLSLSFLQKTNHIPASKLMINLVKENRLLMLRGKYLFPLVRRIISERTKISMVKNLSEENLWEDAIIEGLRTAGSNCRRIAAVFQNAL